MTASIETTYYAICFVAGCALTILAPEPWLALIGVITATGAYIAWLLENDAT